MNSNKPMLSEAFRDAFTQMLEGKPISTCVVGMDALSYTLKKYDAWKQMQSISATV